MPTQNPARAFGPAFVRNQWDDHWVFWLGPCMGGVMACFVYEVIFITHRKKNRSDMSVDGDSVSIRSEADTYDDLGKGGRGTMMRPTNPNPYTRQIPRDAGPGNSYCSAFYPMSLSKPNDNRGEPIYEGSRSMYTRSPPLTRANLNRSQSVYSKNGAGAGSTAHNYIRDPIVRPSAGAPLYPTQSLYPMPINSTNSTPLTQNHQNQQRSNQMSENPYGSKSENPYGTKSENPYGAKPLRSEIYGKIGSGAPPPVRNDQSSGYGYAGSRGCGDGSKKTQQHQDSSENTYNSYIAYSSSINGSKINPTHMENRKESAASHAIMMPSDPYYHSQSSPNSPY